MSRSFPRTLRHRASLAALLPLVAVGSCGGSTSEPKAAPTPKTNPAVRVVVVETPKTTGTPWDPAGKFSVRVEDAEGRGVAGVRVHFEAASGAAGEFKFTPNDTMTTDSTGVAWAGVLFGTRAGPDKLFASATGVLASAAVEVLVTHGTPMFLRINTYNLELFQAGDSASFQAYMVDGWQNVIADMPYDFQVSDSTLISVTPPATPNGNGVVRSLRANGTATFKAAGVENPPLVSVTVYSSPRSACGRIAPQELALGVLTTVTDSVLCLAANDRASEYALMMYNESTDGAATLGTTVTAYNLGPALINAPVPNGPLLSRSPTLLRRSSAPTLDLHFHERLLERSRSLRRLFAPARAARSLAQRGSAGRIVGPRLSYSVAGAGVTVPAVNDLIALNVAQADCSNADMRTFRVAAVGDKSIVLADTANPTGGFQTGDYQRFAAQFDTLVYPLDVAAFGDPSDIDGNARVAILFTRAVNELTPANSGSYVGGFFHPRDLFPRTQSPTLGVCATSNEGEMVYMMVPDPTGTVNGNRFRFGMVDTLTTAVLAHELQHLINAGRRMYVNTAAQAFEETWLNEGLSHTAEELLYFRESGFVPRFRLTANSINDTWAHFAPWVSDDASNFVRFYLYLLDPANHSPIDLGDDLETRGATWAFLRYAVDRSFPSDAGVWQRFTNSTTTGLGTLSVALQRDPKPLLRDFAAANMSGWHPTWDYASVYSQLFVAGKYPLAFGGLKDGTAVPMAAKGGSASYSKFSVPANAQTLLRFGSSAAPRDGNLTFMLVRTTYFVY